MTEPIVAPRMNVSDAVSFLNSQDGNEMIAFMNEYIKFANESRAWFSGLMQETRLRLLQSQKSLDKILARMCEIEVISSLYMTSEDIAAFCLAYELPLEEIPRAVVGMPTGRINDFYRDVNSWSEGYFDDLWLNVDPSDFVSIINPGLVKAIQDQNVKFAKFIFQELAEFRQLYGRLHNKYKHCFPIWLRFAPSDFPDEACANVVFAFDDVAHPMKNVKAFIVGEHLVCRVTSLHTMSTHFFEALLRTRLNWVRYNCKRYPKTVVYGKNPLSDREWVEYKKIVQDTYPTPLAPWLMKPKVTLGSPIVADQEKWIHSSNATTDWLNIQPRRFFLKA